MSKEKEPHDLVFRRGDEGRMVWDCTECGETVHMQVDGTSVSGVIKAQKEHVCPKDLAKKRLPGALARLEEFLSELGVRIEIYEDSYYSGSAELMLVDIKTRARTPFGNGTLG